MPLRQSAACDIRGDASIASDLQVRDVYDMLEDELSCSFFCAGLYAHLRDNLVPLYDLLLSLPRGSEANDIISMVSRCKNGGTRKRIVFYGTAQAEEMLRVFSHYRIPVTALYGDKAHNPSPFTHPVESIDRLEVNGNLCVVISDHGEEGRTKEALLLRKGFAKEQIFPMSVLWKRQYFDRDIMIPSRDEVFVDGGAYNGATIVDFLDWCQGNYRKMYILEPDPHNFSDCREKVLALSMGNISLMQAAVWSENTRLPFCESHTQSAHIDAHAQSMVKAVSIDELLGGEAATFIKLDVEGAELEALKGARKTIRKERPRLAVCLYHKPEDFWEIPRYLYNLNPHYRFYIRHYSTYKWETVLLAV